MALVLAAKNTHQPGPPKTPLQGTKKTRTQQLLTRPVPVRIMANRTLPHPLLQGVCFAQRPIAPEENIAKADEVVTISVHSPGVQPEALLDAYFSRFHAKPFHILDESSLRQRLQLNQVPSHLLHAIYAVTARYAAAR